jgi:hypothetical protein
MANSIGLISSFQNDGGFYAELFATTSSPKKQIIAFRGTDGILDIIPNLGQGLGYMDGQYQKAMRIGKMVKESGDEVEFVGHSLGGGLASLAGDDRWDLVYFSYQHGADLTDYYYRQIGDGYDENGNFKYKRIKWQLDRNIQKFSELNEFYIKEYNALVYKKAIKDILRSKGFKFPELEDWEVKAGKTESYEKHVKKIE